MMKNRYRSISLFTLAALAAGCSAGASGNLAPEEPTLPRGATATSSTEVAPRDQAKEHWRRQMSKTPPAKEGCFAAVHPSMEWVNVPCATGRHSPPPHRQGTPRAGSPAENSYADPARGPVAPDSGRAGDAPELGRANAEPSSEAPAGAAPGSGTSTPPTSGTVSSGTISWAEGSFPNATGLTGENDNGTSNDFSLQLNTQSNFTNSAVAALCKATANPSSCTGWVQFVYWEGAAEIWYNLINAGSTCPSSAWQNVNGSCYYEAPNTSPISNQAISNLPNMTLSGVAGGTTDAVIVTTGPGALYAAVNTSLLDLSPEWTYADFNVLGNGSYGTATFNTGTTLGVQLLTDSATGNTSAPTCSPYSSTTGESNDLSFVSGSCCTFGGDVPGIVFTESNASSPTAFACPAGLSSTVYMVANNGGSNQVWKYGGSGANWTAITGTNTSVSQISTTVSSLYMVATNSGPDQIWQYGGSGASWAPITGTGTAVTSTSGDQGGKALYMVGTNGGTNLVWQYDWAGTNWTPLTGSSTSISLLAETSDVPYIVATNGGPDQLWQYTGSGTNWTPLTGTNTSISQIAATGGVVYMVATNGGPSQLWKYSGSGSNWTAITGTGTAVSKITASGGNLYMLATNGGPDQIWQYSGSGTNWAPITGTGTNVAWVTATGDHVYALANNGGSNQLWQYSGSGTNWAPITGTNTKVLQVAETVAPY